jgi:small-conductance mechanosensitive channel
MTVPQRNPVVMAWRRRTLAAVLIGGHVAMAAAALAQPAPARPPHEQTPSVDPAASLAQTAVESATVDAPAATLAFENRPIVEFRATVLSRTPAMRAAAAERFLRDFANQPGLERVVTRPLAGAVLVRVGTVDAFAIVPADLDPLGTGTIENAAWRAAASLQLALDEADELRSPWRIAKSAGWALLATLALVVLLRLLARGNRWAVMRITRATDRQLQRLPGGEVVRASHLPGFLRTLLTLMFVAGGLLVVYSWLSYVLRRFPYTRPWGEALRGFLFERLAQFGESMLGAIPDLFTVALIVVVTRFVVNLDGVLFEAVERERASLPWVHPDTAQITRRLTTALLWLFALALAFPHLPGSDTEAFKGVSVFVGLMVSLGSSGIVNQAMSGLTMTYSRALKKGDFVKIGDVEGTVTHMGMLSTKLKTLYKEELTIPNAVVISTVTTNYSRLQREEGVMVPTSITIGYDAPWRQVHALLLLAAERTPGIRREPPPVVRQAGLRDFYVEYTLLVCLEDPASKGVVLDVLHANIQDAFNEYGVQIMSPNYEADPNGPKIVPRDQWFAAPASAPDTRHG